ncbi:MAG: RAMP superfamily CRISPR-associated protein [Spirosomaceae bacterium]|jgi:CRISPR/Cas system CSM-associated protein Csm3 (group 7 of RAMP superfamily)|nr:RAMP superfamily CRISPR-associated protein [Spirosomataceae bacterium]
MEIKYRITFLSDWHIGSGLAGGAEADAIVLKDKSNLPYIPGKTLKGLLKDAFYDINEAKNGKFDKDISELFGVVERGELPTVHFSNAELDEITKTQIIKEKLSDYLYRNIASTAINKNGVAESQSLRVMEVTIPLSLVGRITFQNEKFKESIELALKWVRHVGVNRNRGLGRCKIETI